MYLGVYVFWCPRSLFQARIPGFGGKLQSVKPDAAVGREAPTKIMFCCFGIPPGADGKANPRPDERRSASHTDTHRRAAYIIFSFPTPPFLSRAIFVFRRQKATIGSRSLVLDGDGAASSRGFFVVAYDGIVAVRSDGAVGGDARLPAAFSAVHARRVRFPGRDSPGGTAVVRCFRFVFFFTGVKFFVFLLVILFLPEVMCSVVFSVVGTTEDNALRHIRTIKEKISRHLPSVLS